MARKELKDELRSCPLPDPRRLWGPGPPKGGLRGSIGARDPSAAVTLRMKSVLEVGTSLGVRIEVKSSDLTLRLCDRPPSELERRMPAVSPRPKVKSLMSVEAKRDPMLLLRAERCMAGVRVKLNDDEAASRSLDMEEREVEVEEAGSNHAGGRVDVSDLLRFRVRDGAVRSDVSLKDAMLCD